MSKPVPSDDTVPTPLLRPLLAAIKRADVIYLLFPRVRQALLFDLRTSEHDRPAILLAPYEVAPAEQVARIAHLRPGFDAIKHLASLSWGGSTRAFAEQGILPALLGRLPPDLTPAAMAAFQSLREIERGTTNAPMPPVLTADAEAE